MTCSRRRARILLADRQRSSAAALAQLLESDGFDVDLALDAATACACMQGDGHDLVVVDMTMPREQSVVVVEAARSRSPEIPVFFVTSRPRLALRWRGWVGPAPRILGKPLDYAELVREIVLHIADRGAANDG